MLKQSFQLWRTETHESASVKLTQDALIRSRVLEILTPEGCPSAALVTTSISCPPGPGQSIGIRLPFLTIQVKNLNRYFSFEVEVEDDQGVVRRFRCSNFNTTTRVKEYICTMPLLLDAGWNIVKIDLAQMVRCVYGTQFTEVRSITIHPNCLLRRIFFSDKNIPEEDLPADFRLHAASDTAN
ncbi:hypothetical protein H696_04657 [Fonticula alba]|uniref:CFA20 domain-containing protein n=1 Tax=Fonticula alba TaxID=691883 RepID=A0A058Z4N9_FONAL|nr:hypothetical protein H696_04657 [Fonticula alba]KCV69240.1 hypothetical protein H696_04657 [Fonticula alba]|eukprot:XP_009496811.1 hypothetical protein H696_04657 [Fonticula alba]